MPADHTKDQAKLFTNGGSQAVRLPKAYRFDGSYVYVRREGSSVILEPAVPPSWPPGFWERLASMGPVTEDFAVPTPLPSSAHRDTVLAKLDAEDAD